MGCFERLGRCSVLGRLEQRASRVIDGYCRFDFVGNCFRDRAARDSYCPPLPRCERASVRCRRHGRYALPNRTAWPRPPHVKRRLCHNQRPRCPHDILRAADSACSTPSTQTRVRASQARTGGLNDSAFLSRPWSCFWLGAEGSIPLRICPLACWAILRISAGYDDPSGSRIFATIWMTRRWITP